ncbi:hypothetical protein AVEN_33895-1 [Araneus ventricosus]|uniref:Reverse transcriptase domain-containing protein n=1 Tax=Araneus ventricosus TaxID=182803 RepID=A0A4Y2EH31_ARAVE|nr:hypothetical protein AVEN_33895-1 [Araneus ventricosus]
MVLSLNIKGAFDNPQRKEVLGSLGKSRCPANINRLFHNLLENRQVTLFSPQGRITKEQKQWCPQGSCSGPVLGNVSSNEILQHDWKTNVHTQAFAVFFSLSILSL